jgi:hypothetical protein
VVEFVADTAPCAALAVLYWVPETTSHDAPLAASEFEVLTATPFVPPSNEFHSDPLYACTAAGSAVFEENTDGAGTAPVPAVARGDAVALP